MKTLTAANIKPHRCPSCGSEEVRRSQMKGIWERGILKAVGVNAYRCERCDLRYYGRREMETIRRKLD